MAVRIGACWKHPRGCCACCPCCRLGATGPVPSSPPGSASPPGPSATTSPGCAGSAIRSTRGRVSPAGTGSAQRCAAAAAARRRGGGRGRGRTAYRRERLDRGDRGDLGARAGEAAAGASRRGCAIGSARSSRPPCRCRRTARGWIHDVLTVIASACRDHERLRFDYRAHSGAASRRSVEPYRLVNDRRRWYLVAWDLGPGRLAYLPGRPDRAADAYRTALHAPCTAARPGDRGAGGTRSRRGDLAVPGAGDRARTRGIRARTAADPAGGAAR